MRSAAFSFPAPKMTRIASPALYKGKTPKQSPSKWAGKNAATTLTSHPLNLHPESSDPRVSVPVSDCGKGANKRQLSPTAVSAPSNVKRTSTVSSTLQLRQDRLGTLVRKLANQFTNASSWENFVEQFRGRSYLSEKLESVQHPASDLLIRWRDEGVPVLSSDQPWSQALKDERFERGCHKSANEHSEFLREELAEFIESGFWVVLPYCLVKDLPNLQITPAAVKEERERKPRLLCDHSWYTTNSTTLPHSPPESMQIGGALERTIRKVRRANPRYGPVRTAKHDIKDGFYRMFLRATECPRLALVPPRYEGEEPLIAIPMSCTMGWAQSPPTFCTMSETICDIASVNFELDPYSLPVHRLEEAAYPMDNLERDPKPEPRGDEDNEAAKRLAKVGGVTLTPENPDEYRDVPPSNLTATKPLAMNDVFVDDFIQAGQGGTKRMRALRRHLLTAVDQVLSQPLPSEELRNEAISLKKFLKGDGSWGTRKLILGWILDTLRQTLEIPAHRKDNLAEIFEHLSSTRRVSYKQWQRILGKLRFVSYAIPGSAGLFSALQHAQNKANGNRVRVTKHLQNHVLDFARLAADLCHRPTYLAELVPESPKVLGACDAARQGMGGIFFDASGEAYLWRHPFEQDIQAELVSEENPHGKITNSDLEQAGVLCQHDVVCLQSDCRYATIETMCDNTPAVSRFRKGAVSSASAAAYLCREASRHRRQHRYYSIVYHIPGDANVMADDASRNMHLTDSEFLALFEQKYPQPRPWRLLMPRPETISRLTSALRCKQPTKPMSSRPRAKGTTSSKCGHPSVTRFLSTARSPISPKTQRPDLPTSSSLECGIERVAEPGNLSELTQWRKPSWQWERGSPTWVNLIPDSKMEKGHPTIPYSLLSSKPSATKMNRRHGYIRRPSRSLRSSLPRITKPDVLIHYLRDGKMSSRTSVSLVSTGFSALPNIPENQTVDEPKHSAFATSNSRSAANSIPTTRCL